MTNELISTHIIDNLINVMRIAVQHASHHSASIEDLEGSLRYYSGCEYPFFNGVFNNYNHSQSIIIDNLEKITAFFATKNSPFIWWWTQQSEIPLEIKNNLDANGFEFLGDFIGITAKLDEIKFSSISDRIEIAVVNTPEEYKLFLNILCEVFNMSESIKADLKEMYKSYQPQGKFKHYIGYYDGEPAATLTSYIDGQILGLYNGATQTKFQKKGLCAALAHHAIKEKTAVHCQYAVSQLMAPGMAKGLSEKMGFKTYCSLLPFLKDPRKTHE
jgi:hypothetical protein